jgi:hypothetical protein
MSYSLRIHPEADLDAEEDASFIGERSLEGMLHWLNAYESAQERLIRNTFECGYAYIAVYFFFGQDIISP